MLSHQCKNQVLKIVHWSNEILYTLEGTEVKELVVKQGIEKISKPQGQIWFYGPAVLPCITHFYLTKKSYVFGVKLSADKVLHEYNIQFFRVTN